MRRLDRFPTALREYGFVSVEPSPSAVTADPAGRLKATGIDVRAFPWIRPLAGDYAYNFKQVEGLYAGNPLEPEAWRDAVSRAQQQTRKRCARELCSNATAGKRLVCRSVNCPTSSQRSAISPPTMKQSTMR